MRKTDKYYDKLTMKDKKWLDDHTDYIDQDYAPHTTNLMYVPEQMLQVLQSLTDFTHKDFLSSMTLGVEEWKVVEEKCNLSDREKTCMYMCYWEGIKVGDISKKLGITQQAVSYYIRNGKNKLAKVLK